MSQTPTPPTVPPSDALTDDTRAFWRGVSRKMVEDSIGSLDEAAKQLVGVAGILAGLYVNAIAFSNLHGKGTSGWLLVLYTAPIALLLLTLVAALLVFFPGRYSINIHSSQASQLIYERILTRKRRILAVSAVCLVFSLSAILYAVIIYLRG
jgi:hypothetical protein